MYYKFLYYQKKILALVFLKMPLKNTSGQTDRQTDTSIVFI